MRNLILCDEAPQNLIGAHTLVLKPFAPDAAAKVLEIFLSFDNIHNLYVAPVADSSIQAAIEQQCHTITAAGGLVVAPNGDVLMIYRRNLWDLPKGKAEAGEAPQTTALREVQEETGLTSLTIVRPLTTTHHIYIQDGQTILKNTHWFHMQTDQPDKLVPQQEEEITQACFIPLQEALQRTQTSFPTIQRVLAEYRP